VLGDQPLFFNAVVTGMTALDARSMLDELLAIEQDFGRERPYPGAARTLDLDLILLGDDVIDEPGLQVPHPRFRGCVLVAREAADRDPRDEGESACALREVTKGPGTAFNRASC
jgi:2-amino-4-hydroxy-6-hydroxymethyldihydropteridine diphosphokinase